jgi:hypothetical protein
MAGAVVECTERPFDQVVQFLGTAIVLDFLTNEPVATVAPIRRAPTPD